MFIERRFSKHMEVHASQGDEGSMIVTGYAAKWNRLSENLGGFRERLVPGCFQRSLQSDRNVHCNFNHDASQILGTRKAGTLAVNEDGTGLHFRCNVAPTSTGRDVYNLVKRGDLADCSFAFMIDDDGGNGDSWTEIDDPETSGQRIGLRTVSQAKLLDVSLVASPAYQGTSVTTEQNKLPELNSHNLFPAGVPQSFPMEVRSKIMASQNRSHRQELARQRAIALMLD
jgi:HK97 family phage prohead protease